MQLQIDHDNQTTHPPRRRPLSNGIVIAICAVVIVVIAALGIILDQYVIHNDSPWDPVPGKTVSYAMQSNPPLDEQKTLLLRSATDLIGKVHYFWGGKSKCAGWDENWGKPTEVTSEGSETTGTLQPFGLDCSGFVTWCFIQTGYTWEEAIALVGNGTANQFRLSREIPWNELQAGDLAFQNEPGDPEGNHVGICIGYDRGGEPLFVHCAASEDNVVVTHADGIFEHARRPNIYQE